MWMVVGVMCKQLCYINYFFSSNNQYTFYSLLVSENKESECGICYLKCSNITIECEKKTHTYCNICMEKVISNFDYRNSFHKCMVCMAEKKDVYINYGTLGSLQSMYNSAMERMLETKETNFTCFYPDCKQSFMVTEGNGTENCPHCKKSICFECTTPGHVGVSCIQTAKQRKQCSECQVPILIDHDVCIYCDAKQLSKDEIQKLELKNMRNNYDEIRKNQSCITCENISCKGHMIPLAWESGCNVARCPHCNDAYCFQCGINMERVFREEHPFTSQTYPGYCFFFFCVCCYFVFHYTF